MGEMKSKRVGVGVSVWTSKRRKVDEELPLTMSFQGSDGTRRLTGTRTRYESGKHPDEASNVRSREARHRCYF